MLKEILSKRYPDYNFRVAKGDKLVSFSKDNKTLFSKYYWPSICEDVILKEIEEKMEELCK